MSTVEILFSITISIKALLASDRSLFFIKFILLQPEMLLNLMAYHEFKHRALNFCCHEHHRIKIPGYWVTQAVSVE